MHNRQNTIQEYRGVATVVVAVKAQLGGMVEANLHMFALVRFELCNPYWKKTEYALLGRHTMFLESPHPRYHQHKYTVYLVSVLYTVVLYLDNEPVK